MAEETSTEDLNTPGEQVYKQVGPSGLAAEVTADDPVKPETITALGRWLTEKLAANPAARDHVASLSGLSLADLAGLMDGHPLFPLDTDHLQRIATALVEAQVIPHAEEVWKAIGSEADTSDYVLPPAQVLRAMSSSS